MTGCDDDPESSSEIIDTGNSLGYSINLTFDIFDFDSFLSYNVSTNFTKVSVHYHIDEFLSLNDCISNSEVKTANGKITIKLGTPTTFGYNNLFYDWYSEFPTDVKSVYLVLEEIPTLWDIDKRFSIAWMNPVTDDRAFFLYVDKDVNIFNENHNGWSYNLTLKTGWNTVLLTDKKIISGKPDSNFKWYVIDFD